MSALARILATVCFCRERQRDISFIIITDFPYCPYLSNCVFTSQAKFHIIQELLGKLHSIVASTEGSKEYMSLLRELNEERQKARCTMKDMFNSSFGATFLTDTGQESAFAYHIHQYADVYTSKPDNFLFHPPEAWLHVPYDIKIMPHHVKVYFVFVQTLS